MEVGQGLNWAVAPPPKKNPTEKSHKISSDDAHRQADIRINIAIK
jgi:hypothetical protein